MKKLIVLLALLPVIAAADQHVSQEICTHDVVYTIYDEHGNVMDRTKYIRNWPLDCVTSTRLKYETLRKLGESGEAQFEALVGGN